MNQRWKNRPPGSNWGEFGADDELGRLNLLTAERRVQAAREVRAGEAFCLSLPLDLPGGTALNPNRLPPKRHVATRKRGLFSVNYPLRLEDARYVDCSSDDSVTLYTQYSTQWDALSHVGQYFDVNGDGIPVPVYYNGFRAGVDVMGPTGDSEARAHRLGIEKMAETGVQGRGVMLDLHAHYGDVRTYVGYDALQRVIDADRVDIQAGDMLCLHTGFGQKLIDMGGDPDPQVLHHSCAVLDGRDERLLRWIDESGISVLIADNFAVEGYPYEKNDCPQCEGLPLHQACLFRLGIHLGELWYLTPLAQWLRRNGRSHFMLTCPPLRLPGSFGSPVTPVATV
ncbi:cyclase [Achromobacter denitrificans]|uniref:cyclase family protein n=1 Tax=Achromobacter denitrificans TaxID=32002 RepID=UPI001665912D|nr:cyclase family protein [Achromobacter denitrificans]GFN27722.1 cyclase [Achromobacter denitrificans]